MQSSSVTSPVSDPPRRRPRRVLAVVAALLVTGLLATGVLPAEPAAAAEACVVEFDTSVSAAGFTHPGVGVTAEILDNARDRIRAGANPWTTYFEAMRTSPAASRTATSSNASAADPTVPASIAFDSQGFNGRFIADGLKAYTQALMYVFTGEQVYRSNAMRIIRIWAKMDPARYAAFTDSHIHTGVPLNRMVTAAEILRYGHCAADEAPWTGADTAAFGDNLVVPVIETFQHDQNQFMNQHLYPLLGAMAGYVFLDDADRYAEAVEWFTVNSTAADRGFNGSIQRLFRLVDRDDATGAPLDVPRVQHVEMGRDQAHGGGDITNAYMLARLMMAQGTTVDPVDGTISTAPDAVGPYEFGDDRILAAADYFWRFMLGRDVDWTPVGYAISPDGTVRDTYDRPSDAYRGRYNTAGFWDLYYHYTYVRGLDLAQVAPSYAEAFAKRLPPDHYYRGALTRAWDNVDGGGDFWLYTPAAAAGSPVPRAQTSATVLEVEDRYTHLSGEVRSLTEAGTSFVRLTAGDGPARIAFLNGSTTQRRIALRVRGTGSTELRLSFGLNTQVLVPDTDGRWQQVVIDLKGAETVADLLYLEAVGGGTVDVDALLVDTAALTPVRFADDPERIVTVAGAGVAAALPVTGGASGSTRAFTATGLPDGAVLDPATGELTWTPAAPARAEATVAVGDGTTVHARRLTLAAAQDRPDALRIAQEPRDAGTVYTRASQQAHDAALDAATAAQADTAARFQDALDTLVRAVDALAPVSPRTAAGSLDYPALLASSTAGTKAFHLVDGDNQTGTVYTQAVNLSHVFDFGPFARVRADRFGLRSNIFEDRLANAAVFGSNDGSSWTRLTPGVTTMTQDLQSLDVATDLRDDAFQYLKVQILEPQPDVLRGRVQGLFEITEFHVLGDRSETVGELTGVGLSAPGSLRNRVVPGDAVTLGFTASAPIRDVRVSLAGVDVTPSSTDGGRTWTASVTVPGSVTPGALRFAIDHTTSTGAVADTVTATSDGSRVHASTDEGLVDGRLRAAPVSAAPGTANPNPAAEAARLFDGDAATHTDTRPASGRAALVWDLGEGSSLSISGVDLLVRQDQYGTGRLSTLRFEGSDDAGTWTPLTSTVQASPDWQRLTSRTGQGFRYIRLTNGNIINVAEARVFGEYRAPVSVVTGVTLTSSNTLRNYAVPGDTLTAEITTSEVPQQVSATIEGAPATVRGTASPTRFLATAVLAAGSRTGSDAAITVDHVTADGTRAVPTRATTDGSTVRLGTTDRLVTGLREISTMIRPDGSPDTSTVARPQHLFDGSLSTFTDARPAGGSADIIFDLGTRRIALDRIELAMRQDGYGLTRIRNLRVQGSNDRQRWDTLVAGISATHAWQGHPVDPAFAGGPYRYLRITNGDILNIAELRPYGVVGP